MLTRSYESQPPSRLQVTLVVSFYMAAALVMVFVNKAVLNSTPDLPFTFLFIQLVIAVVLLHTAAFLSSTSLSRYLPGKIELPILDVDVLRKLLPFMTVGVAGLVFNTLCLAKVDTSFFQIARGLLLPFTIAISALQARMRPRPAIILAAFIVTAGFFMGTSPSSFFNSSTVAETQIVSIMYGCLSSFLLAIHAVLAKPATAYVGNSVIKLIYWGNLVAAVMLIPCILLQGELVPLMALWNSEDGSLRVFVIGSAVTGLFGFLLGTASLLSIKVTSPVTHMFSSAAKSAVQTALGVAIFGDIVTQNRAFSILVITIGTVYYTWIKSRIPPPRNLAPAYFDVEKNPEAEHKYRS